MGDGDARAVVMVVDDDRAITDLVGRWLVAEGHEVVSCGTGSECLDGMTSAMPDVVCLDISLPDTTGLDVLPQLRKMARGVPVIIMTADDHADTAVEAMKKGAYDYLTKPLDRTRFTTTVTRAVERSRMEARLAQLEREAKGQGYPGIIGHSEPMRELFRQLDRVAARDITVLIHGESGTGKELVARAIHEKSDRRDGPMIALNCAAIPETLQESELFGHEKGAFTGAVERRRGRFELAHDGTLFLDEVAELSASLQAKLLRVLQEKAFTRVGGTEPIRSDFRLVTASHKRLLAEVEAGRFRSDLYFRIAVFEVEVPPLRQRKGDVRLLTEKFLLEFMDPGQESPLRLSDEAADVLERYAWPGNVRELQNAIHRACVMASDDVVRMRDLPPSVLGAVGPAGEVEETADLAGAVPAAGQEVLTMDEIEKRAIEQALERNGGNIAEVVRQLGIGRTTLYRKLKKYGIDR